MNLTSFPVIAVFSKYHLCCSTLTNKGSTFLKQQSQCLLSIHLREALRNKNIVGDRNARNSRSEGAKKSYHQDVLCCINHKQLMLLNGPYKDKKKKFRLPHILNKPDVLVQGQFLLFLPIRFCLFVFKLPEICWRQLLSNLHGYVFSH